MELMSWVVAGLLVAVSATSVPAAIGYSPMRSGQVTGLVSVERSNGAYLWLRNAHHLGVVEPVAVTIQSGHG